MTPLTPKGFLSLSTSLIQILLLIVVCPASSQTTAVLDWFRIYDGPEHWIDIETAACIDLAGNFYVAGRSHNILSGPDFAILKFSPQGDQVLDIRIDGSADSWDEPTAIIAKEDGFVVTGNSFLSSGWSTVLTMGFDSVGTLLWRERYPADSSSSSSSVAMGRDNFGNIYIGATPDFTVLKYSGEGAFLWGQTYRSDSSDIQGLTTLAVSPEGNVYATGFASDECSDICSYNVITQKYDPLGNLEWVREFEASEESDQQPTAMVLDADENVLIVAAATDDSTGQNSLILKYSPLGDLEWTRTFDGTTSYDNPAGIAVDAEDNVLVAGTTWTTEPFNYSLVKFDPDGYQLWSMEYGHASGTRDFAFGLSLDNTGSIYLTGSTRVGIIGVDTCVTIRVDPEGDLVWITSFSRPDGGTTHGRRAFVDNNGNVSILGGGAGPLNQSDFLALRYLQIPVGVPIADELPSGEFLLRQNFPNPFNSSTTIEYSIPRDGYVELEVFNMLGEKMHDLKKGLQKAGNHRTSFDADGLSSGVYICRLKTAGFVGTRRLLLIR